MRKWLLVVGVYLLAAMLAGDAAAPDLARADLPPGPGGAFGTDHLGRGLFGWTLSGTRVALLVGTLAATLAVGLGAIAGLCAGWYGGRVDAALLALGGTVAALPGLLLVLVLSYLLGGGLVGVYAAVGLVSWVTVYRLVRAEVRRLRGASYVEAARLQGAGALHLMRAHLLPNLAPLLLVQFTLHFVWAVKAEVILSFLGVGMHDTPSWGLMLADAWELSDLDHGRWWRLTAATLAMVGLLLPVQRIGDHLAARRA